MARLVLLADADGRKESEIELRRPSVDSEARSRRTMVKPHSLSRSSGSGPSSTGLRRLMTS
jgi:hypothetical protein